MPPSTLVVALFLSALLCPSALPDRLARSTQRRFPNVPCHLSGPLPNPKQRPILHTLPYPILLNLDSTRPRLDSNARLLFSRYSITQLSSISSARTVSPSSPLFLVLPGSLRRRPGFPFLAAQVGANLTLPLHYVVAAREVHRQGILGRRILYQVPRCPPCRYSPAQVPHTTLYHPFPTFPSCSSIPPTISSLHFAFTTPSSCYSLASCARLPLMSSTAAIITVHRSQNRSKQPEFDRPARDIQSSPHYRYLLANPHRPRHRLAHPPLPGAPHRQLLIKSISPLSRVTTRFLPINSLIPLTNFGNLRSHLSPLSSLSAIAIATYQSGSTSIIRS